MIERAHDEAATATRHRAGHPGVEAVILSNSDRGGGTSRLLTDREHHRAPRPLRLAVATSAMDEGLLAGVFSTREQAEAAATGLRRTGLTEDVEVRTPLPGRYRLENRASEEIGRAVVIGILSGALGGALGGMKLLPTLVPAVSDAGLVGILLGVLIGGFWGAFYGGVFALGQKVLSRVDEDRWWMISSGGTETLVLVRPGARLDAAHKVMRRYGSQFFLAQIPAAEPADAAPQAA